MHKTLDDDLKERLSKILLNNEIVWVTFASQLYKVS